MAIDLNNLVCLITGAGGGIGRGVVHGFLKRGAKVAGGVRDLDKSAKFVEPALPLQMDVTHSDQVNAAVARTIKEFGRIDVLVNNAGVYPRQPADEMEFEDWRRVVDLNLDGHWRSCQAVIPQMKAQKSGCIINTGSIVYQVGMAHLAHYTASKGGVVGLTRGLARDLGPHGIRVNCVHPGAVLTERELELFPDQDALLEKLNEYQCMEGRLTPETCEPVYAFLASQESRDVTGQCITVDRGWAHG